MDNVSQAIHEAHERYYDTMQCSPEIICISERTLEKLKMECYVLKPQNIGDIPYFEGVRIRVQKTLADFDNKEPNGVPWLFIGEDYLNRREG